MNTLWAEGLKDSEEDRPLWRRHLLAGDLFATSVPHVITTVLGSCVAVCLWDPVLRAGGMNHFMLARHELTSPMQSNRYGDIATLNLIMRMEALGAQRANLRAKIFGGGCVLPGAIKGKAGRIGLDNIEVARAVLANCGIPLMGENVGDFHGRKLAFNTHTGKLWLGYISPLGSQAAGEGQAEQCAEDEQINTSEAKNR